MISTRSMFVMACFLFGILFVTADTLASTTTPTDFYMLVIRSDCWDTFFKNFDLFNISCLKATISKGLGYALILGSCFVKVPQIIKIIQVNNVKDLSPLSVYQEILANVIITMWHLINGSPFSSYGETVIVSFGALVIAGMIWYYDWPGMLHVNIVIGAIAILAHYAYKTPLESSDILLFVGNVVFAASRFTQIIKTIQTQSVESLALITLLMNFAGTVSRVFTASQEVKSVTFFFFTCFNAFLNTFILGQYFYYSKNKASKVAVPDSKKATSTPSSAKKSESKKSK